MDPQDEPRADTPPRLDDARDAEAVARGPQAPEIAPSDSVSTPAAVPAAPPPTARRPGFIRRAFGAVTPGRRAWRGATRGVLAAAFALFLASAWDEMRAPAPNWQGLLALAALVAASFVAGLVLVLVLRGLAALPFRYAWAVFAALGLLVAPFLFTPLGLKGFAALSMVTLLLASLTGAGLATLAWRGGTRATWAARVMAVAGFALGVAGSIAGVAWLVWHGRAAEPLTIAARQTLSPPLVPLTLDDPARPGPYRVLTLTYGSGHDRHRPEFGAQATLTTRPFDGSRFVEGWSGAAGKARTRYWGFDAQALPLQGRVWYPDGAGPFPLVLCVHGNHAAEDFSDPGYAYLGELLASRGFIFVSVDENFLNGALVDLLGFPELQLKEENDLRAVLLLEHLRQWREWNTSAALGQPFHARVDMERVALIGHSRGGEAVAVAAAFNPLPFYPDDATLPFDYRFGLRAVVAVAPVDGQYRPAGTGARPENVDYLVLHGSMDGDMRSYHGERVFERVRFADGRSHFKAGVWVHGANHGQFNTSWGRNDMGGLGGAVLRQAAIVPAEDQQRVAKVFIAAFLEASLHDQPGYRALFRDRRVAGAWLPEAVYLQQYADTDTRVLAGFDEDIDVSTTTLAGGGITAAGLADWKEREVELKWGTLETRAVWLGWDTRTATNAASEPASYTVRWPAGELALTPDAALTFELADSGDEPTQRVTPGGAPVPSPSPSPAASGTAKPRDPIDLTLELRDRAGAVARVPLSRVAWLQPRVEAQVTKLPALDSLAPSEPVLAHFELPLRLFVEANPALDVTQLAQVRFVFDRTPAAVLILDDVAFRVPASATTATVRQPPEVASATPATGPAPLASPEGQAPQP